MVQESRNNYLFPFISQDEILTLIFTVAGFLVPACLFVSTSYAGCDNTSLAVTLFSLAIGIQGLNGSSYTVNHLDIAPRFAGILMGISNSVGTIPGIISPYVVGRLTDNQVMLMLILYH